MALPDWLALTPTLLFALTALTLLVLDAAAPNSKNSVLLAGVAGLGSIAALGFSGWGLIAGTGQGEGGAITIYGGQLIVDGMSQFFTVIVASVAALVIVASFDYVRDREAQGEYYALIVLAATGMSLMASAGSLVTAFVALELSSLPSYALVAFLKENRGSVEAGLKYFLIGALSSAIFAYGISLVYGVAGTLTFQGVAENVAGTDLTGVLGVGILMVLAGLGFKTASVPFHFWAPEAYEGAPAPISAFLSSASKAAGFVLLFRVFVTAFPIDAVGGAVDWVLAFQVLAIVTMTVGNFAAATQDNVKRMLAYSSVGHAGYVLIGLAALGGGNDAAVLGASMLHLFIYGFMNTGAFLFVALAEYWDVGRTFEDYNGLGRQAPVASVAMTVFMVSLAGVPLGGGFWSKLILFAEGIGAGVWWLVVIAVLNSVLSVYFYLRVVKAMWIEDPIDGRRIDTYPVGLYTAVVAAGVITFASLFAVGLLTQPATDAAAALLGSG